MHALSLGTWLIHITTLLEWLLAIVLIVRWGITNQNQGFSYLALAMLPNLASAMAAITWHIFDNATSLYGLVYIQALLTFLGNCSLALASWRIVISERLAAQ